MAKRKTKTVEFEDLRPETIRIMGRDFEIEYRDEEDMDGNYGLCIPDECRILVREGQHEVEEADTLLHEVMHAIFAIRYFHVSGKVEEEIVRGLATGLIQVFKDTPELMTLIAMAGTNRRTS